MKMCTAVQPNRIRGWHNRTHVLLTAVLILVMQSQAGGQDSSVTEEADSPSVATTQKGSWDNPSSSRHHGWFDQTSSRPCRLRVTDSDSETVGGSKETAATTDEPLLYAPLSAHCKFNLFLGTTRSPYTFLSAGFEATLDQAQGQWPHYGGGTQGWGKRFGATLADTESRKFIQTFALSTILHQDPRYFPSRKRSLMARSWYAATRVVITRNDGGVDTFNTSEFLGALFTSSLQNSYYPRHDRTFSDTMNRFSGALSSDAVGNILREFTPDMKRLFRKHAPKKILTIEEKLPIPDDDKP